MTSPSPSPAPPRMTERWSVFAVIGFVCAWLLPPAGLACSIVALARIAAAVHCTVAA